MKSVSLRSLRGKVVVLEWFNPDCPFVKYAHGKGPLRELAKQLGSDKLVWLSINSSGVGKQGNGVDRNRAAKGEYAIENTILLDETGEVGRKYGAEKTPHLFVIDPKGRLVYRGLCQQSLGLLPGQRDLELGRALAQRLAVRLQAANRIG